MILLLTLALFLLTPLPHNVLNNVTETAAVFHEKCLSSVPTSSSHGSTLASLVCGEKITDETLKENLSRTSLIHIFVVSGSHLLLLDQLLSIFKIPLFVRFLLLGFYSLLVGWQAPVVRAFTTLALRAGLKNSFLSFPPDLVVLLGGLLGLVIFPAWWSSLSYQMSWCAGLALSFTAILRLRRSWKQAVTAQLGIFVLMSAPLWGLGSLHPLSIVYNLILAPVVSYALLPLSLASLIHPVFLWCFDGVMGVFEELLFVIAEPIKIVRGPLPSSGFLWFWIFSIHLLLHFIRLRLWQGRDSK